jgi:tetratricopeptide (TPR) repeat protein
MSLLLDARKKSQAAQGGERIRSGFEFSLEEHPGEPKPSVVASPTVPPNEIPSSDDRARAAGQNLFNAKTSAASASFARINRNLLFALGATVLLLAAGGGYVWYVTSADSNPPVLPVARPPAAAMPIAPQPPAITEVPPKIAVAPEPVPSKPARAKQPKRAARSAASMPSQPAPSKAPAPMQIEQHQAESIDPLLNGAYLAYREGKFERAQQLYREALRLDERNTDALLGIAAIAQRRGSDGVAAHYYAKVLELDPRNAVANAGMSALTTNDNIESRLKFLLNEQQDSSSLHFALGNVYASQERWGEAQQAYFNAYKLDSKNAGLAFHLAISLERLGQKKLAAQYYQIAVQLDTSHSEGFDHAVISQRIEELIR